MQQVPPGGPSDARVMDVAIDVADLLLSMGMPATDVIQHASDVCRALCRRRVHIDTASDTITLAQDGTPTEPPLTQVRHVGARALDYGVIAQVSDAVAELGAGHRSLDELEELCHGLMLPQRYPWWQQGVSAGLISAGCGLLFGVDLPVLVATFLIGFFGERLLFAFSRLGLPALIAQAGAAAGIVGVAVLGTTGLGRLGLHIPPEPVVIGGVVMLVVGMKFVSAFQDALDGFYVTATAGIFRVTMLTTGIVVGILVGLWALHHLGVGRIMSTVAPALGPPLLTTIGAAIIAGAYAWYCHANVPGLIVSTVVGAATWAVFLVVFGGTSISEVPASGIASIVAGLAAASVTKRWRIPSLAVMTAGIVTMVPGLRLYLGLLQAVTAPLWSLDFFNGLTTLLGAIGIGLAIPVGASVGVAIGRPLRTRLRMVRAAQARRRSGREPSGATLVERPRD